ncbi:MAG TPA: DUF5777 family beta-barrel protein [Vicinamibacterales bacterium]
MTSQTLAFIAAALLAAPAITFAQTALASGPAAVAPAAAEASGAGQDAADDDEDGISLVEPDFTLVNLPTTLHLPRFGSAFRVTHRFARPLGDGDFGDLLEDFFGFDNGAQIGLEYRFGIWRGAQIGIYRTSDRTIQFFGRHAIIHQGDGRPVTLDAWLAIDGTNNFRDSYSPSVGAVVSRSFEDVLAIYAAPAWVDNTNVLSSAVAEDDTFVLGLGGRLRVLRTVYVTAEVSPPLAGYDPGDPVVAFGVEKRAGGHVFQLNFSNSVGSTLAQQLRTGGGRDDWYIGFNISRKFY